jgi:hypothetical protein
MEAESLLLVLELDHLAVSRRRCKATEASALPFTARLSFLPEREEQLGHGTQIRVKASRLGVNQLLDRAIRIVDALELLRE